MLNSFYEENFTMSDKLRRALFLMGVILICFSIVLLVKMHYMKKELSELQKYEQTLQEEIDSYNSLKKE